MHVPLKNYPNRFSSCSSTPSLRLPERHSLNCAFRYRCKSPAQGAKDPRDLFIGAVLALMILPALQLGASLLAVIGVVLFYPSRSLPLRRIGKISLWSFLGTMIGVLFMGGCCGVLSLNR
jgi:hypothetical protein